MVESSIDLKHKQVLLLNNVPSPYFSPLFSLLAKSAEWNLKTCYITAWNNSVGWTPQSASDFSHLTDTILAHRYPRIARWGNEQVAATCSLFMLILREKQDFFLIYGYTQLPQLFLIGWALLWNIPFAIAGDANFYELMVKPDPVNSICGFGLA